MTDHCNLPEGFAANAAIRIGTDVESIAEGLRILQQSTIPDLQSLGQNGRTLVEREFTAAQMKEVYEWVLGGGPRPGRVRGSGTGGRDKNCLPCDPLRGSLPS